LWLAAPALGIVVMLLFSGCVTPTKVATSSSASSTYYVTETTSATTTVSPPSYVTSATPFGTSNAAGMNGSSGSSNPYATPTPIPSDLSCLIYQNTQYFSYNTTAVAFDLKTPPMYITYSVIPFNITVVKYVKSGYGSNNWVTLQYSDYAPYSWFEITVRDKASGKIYLQDGFGQAQGMRIYTNATLGPVLNSGDLLVEMTGKNITATTGIWVKPQGNIEDSQNQTFSQCKYWTSPPQNYLAVPSPTATPTWVPN